MGSYILSDVAACRWDLRKSHVGDNLKSSEAVSLPECDINIQDTHSHNLQRGTNFLTDHLMTDSLCAAK